METIPINSKLKDYEIVFMSKQMLSSLVSEIVINDPFFVVDDAVWKLYSKNTLESVNPSRVLTIVANEENKSCESVLTIYDQFVRNDIKRNSTVMVIGGGIIQDLAGFACSTYYRGVNWIFIPTTLLAQADSCIGGKTSLNFGGYKNVIGTFFPPSKIFICPDFLSTLDDVFYYSGLGEVAKLHIIGGVRLVNELIDRTELIQKRHLPSLEVVIRNSLLVKKSFIVEDEFDQAKRKLLNYGHCFGHAIESATNFAITHGQAVLLGMFLANTISVRRGIFSMQQHKRISENIIEPMLISTMGINQLNTTKMIDAMKKDKKRTDDRLIVILISNNLELAEYNDLTLEEIDGAIMDLRKWILKE